MGSETGRIWVEIATLDLQRRMALPVVRVARQRALGGLMIENILLGGSIGRRWTQAACGFIQGYNEDNNESRN